MKSLVLALLFVSVPAFAAIDLEKTYPESQGVTEVKSKKEIARINQILEEVDPSFEMGDGYYNLLQVQLFKVKDGRTLVGYIELYKLDYTEDPEIVYAIQRYDARGKRVGEIEETDRVRDNRE